MVPGNIFVSDTGNGTIREISGGNVTTLAGTAGNYGSADGTNSTAQFFAPQGIAVDGSDNVFVADTFNHTLRKITPAGVVTISLHAASSAEFRRRCRRHERGGAGSTRPTEPGAWMAREIFL